jgi:hypothetical protein
MDTINTELGTVSDTNDILALKTTVSPLFCLFSLSYSTRVFCVFLACCVGSSYLQLPHDLFLKLVERDCCFATWTGYLSMGLRVLIVAPIDDHERL